MQGASHCVGHPGGGTSACLSYGTLSPESSPEHASGAHVTCRSPSPLTDSWALLDSGHQERPETKTNNTPVDIPCVSTEHCFGKLLPESPSQEWEAHSRN